MAELETPNIFQNIIGPEADLKEQLRKRNRRLKASVDLCKTYKRKLVHGWQANIDYRRGKPFASQSDEDRIHVNLDWSLTKQKQAQLFSQVPAIRLSHPPQTTDQKALPWVHNYEQRINDTLIKSGIETAMDECLPDCINAAGFGVVMVSHEAITVEVQVPKIDLAMLPPEIHQMVLQSGMMPDGTPIEMETVPKILDSRYIVARVSPADFLWPLDFTGSDFDNAPWVGRSGRISWAEAVKRFKLDPSMKSKYVGDSRQELDKLAQDSEQEITEADEVVSFDEIFYKEFQYDPESQSFLTIHHLVFINNQEKPVIDEAWKGQEQDQETGELVGVMRYPLRVLSLAYITDEAIPPSDSAIARPQVNEINKGRTQMILQREHSIPVRWVDINRVDPTILYNLMRGMWQGVVPVQGVGTNIIGEVARSAMPQENFVFDRIAKEDLARSVGVSDGQWGADIETKSEVEAVSGEMQTRIARERAKVGKFFTGIAEVLGGLIAINEDEASFGEGFNALVSKTLSYSILADSTVLLDSTQRIKRLESFINFVAKSGFLNIEPVLKEYATLHGLDPSVVIKAPEPKAPETPNISFRLTGTEDVMNPLTLAFLINSGQAPSIEHIDQAKKLIEQAVTPPIPPPLPDGTPGDIPPGMPPPDVTLPQPPPVPIGKDNPDWGALDRVNQRVVEREGGPQ